MKIFKKRTAAVMGLFLCMAIMVCSWYPAYAADAKVTYSVMLQDAEHGQLEFSKSEGETEDFQAGETVALNIHPDKGYTAVSVLVRDAENHRIVLSDGVETEKYEFDMPKKDVTVSVLFEKEGADSTKIPENYVERCEKDRELLGEYTPQANASGTLFKSKAQAAAARAAGQLSVGKVVWYDAYNTNEFHVDGNFAYCAQPSKGTPGNGSYTKVYDYKWYLSSQSDDQAEVIRRVLYYCYGSPGFDAGMFPRTWYDGSAMNADRYIALSHILIADVYSYSAGDAMYGCSWGFKNWVAQNVTGYNISTGQEINSNSTRHQAIRKGAPGSFKAYILDTGSWTQNILSYEYNPEGYAKLKKESSNPAITDGNSCYSLDGAYYGIWKNKECTEGTGVAFTIDANGNSNTLTLSPGTYYVREITAPKGYALDKTVYSVTVTSGQTATLTVKDLPTMDPVGVLLGKVDAETNQNKPQGSASLEGALFEVKFYNGLYDTDPAQSGKTAARSWVFRTNENGFCYYESKYLESGDELYMGAEGVPSFPIGTVTIQEIQPPEGYLLNPEVYVVKITSENNGSEFVYTYNEPTIPENTLDLNIVKSEKGEDRVIPGAVFRHTLPDGSTEEVTTDENGETTFTGLTWGEHTVEEISVPDGYTVNPGKVTFTVEKGNKITVTSNTATEAKGSMTFTVQDDGCALLEVEDVLAPYKLTIHKQNESSKTLQGAEFTLYSDKACTQMISKGTTQEDGTMTFSKLVVGTSYYLKETKAPEGYRIPINADGSDIVYEIRTESNPLTDTFEYYVDGKVHTGQTGDYAVNGTKAERVVNLTVLNYIGIEMPNTGTHVSLILFLLGMGCIMASVIGYLKKNNGKV